MKTLQQHIEEKLVINKDYKNFQSKEIIDVISILTNPKVKWNSSHTTATTENEIWGKFKEAFNKFTGPGKDKGEATEENPTFFKLSARSNDGIYGGATLAYKIFSGKNVFYIKSLEPGNELSGIEIMKRHIIQNHSQWETGKFTGASAVGRWQIDKDVSVTAEGFAISSDFVDALNSIIDG